MSVQVKSITIGSCSLSLSRHVEARTSFGRDPKMVAERAGECFVRAVIRLQRQGEDIRRAVCQRPRRLGETPCAHIAHDGKSRRGGERPHHVEARDSGNARDLVERQRIGQMAFDKPERLLGGIHGQRPSFEATRIMIALPAPHLTVLALIGLPQLRMRQDNRLQHDAGDSGQALRAHSAWIFAHPLQDARILRRRRIRLLLRYPPPASSAPPADRPRSSASRRRRSSGLDLAVGGVELLLMVARRAC